MIVGRLSVQDLKSLRQAERRLDSSVLAYPPYHLIRTRAPVILDALFTTRLSRFYSANQILDVLYTDRCSECCNDFGAFVFLPRLERCCAQCLRLAPDSV